jgi:predicted SnoaL-like aldol condensation-catalyzing enzyme
MKHLLTAMAFLVLACQADAQDASAAPRGMAERNKAAAIAYWKALNTQGWDAANQYRSAKFHEHGGSAPSGTDELKAHYNALKARQPEHYSLIKRAIAQGDLVFLHVQDISGPGDFGTAIMCYLRFEDGKIVEQWTAKQAVPGIRNFNGMF